MIEILPAAPTDLSDTSQSEVIRETRFSVKSLSMAMCTKVSVKVR